MIKQNKPKYVQIKNYIKKSINNKLIIAKLPGERTLAKQLGFSYMTVRKAIEELVHEGVLYKVPTKGAFVNTNKKAKEQHTIGYFLDSNIKSNISSPYYSLIFHAIEKEATKYNYSVVYFSDANQQKLVNTLSKLDGVIASCFPRTKETILEIRLNTPVVVIDNKIDDEIPSVVIDNFDACVKSVDYIYSLGHQRIGFMTGLDDSNVGKDRYNGYLHGLKNNNITLDNSLVCRGNYSYEAGIKGAKYFLTLKHLPSAIICANDSMALGVIKGLKEVGVDIPNDIAIIGFDDIEIASQVTPSLTTIAAPVSQIAEHAFAMLKNLMEDKALQNQHIVLDTSLITRQTCAPREAVNI